MLPDERAKKGESEYEKFSCPTPLLRRNFSDDFVFIGIKIPLLKKIFLNRKIIRRICITFVVDSVEQIEKIFHRSN